MTSIPASFIDQLQTKAHEFGFQQLEIGNIDLAEHEAYLLKWLNSNFHGSMDYMQRHGVKRSRPEELEPGTLRVISVRMDYLPPEARSIQKILNDSNLGCISRYALGRDYHKLIRNRLLKLVNWMQDQIGEFGYRVLDRKSTRLNSSHITISYAVFCLKKKTNTDLSFELVDIVVDTYLIR